MRIYLDPRAGSGDLAPLLQDRVSLVIEQMPFGDAAFDGHGPKGLCGVGVEIKKLNDVLDCAISKRFAGRQMPGMRETYDYCYLLIEGRWGMGERGQIQQVFRKGPVNVVNEPKTPLTYSGFSRWINTIAIKAGFVTFRTNSREETADMLVSLATWWAKPWADHHAHQALDRSLHNHPSRMPLTKPGQQRIMIGESPAIGWEKSQRVLQHFGSIHAAVNAPVEEWMKIDGIGRKTAETIYHFYRKDVRK